VQNYELELQEAQTIFGCVCTFATVSTNLLLEFETELQFACDSVSCFEHFALLAVETCLVFVDAEVP